MKKIIYILSIVFIFTGCTKDFLEIGPETNLNSQDFYTTQNEFNTALNATYAKLQSQVEFYVELVEWRSDNLDLSAPTAGTQDRYNINKFIETSANELIRDAWANYFNGILRCNVITDNLKSANFDENIKNQIEAEARFIRALTYFNMVRLWGDIPIILTKVSPTESLLIGRSPVSEVYKAIEADLEFASQNLPTTNNGKATSGAAKALLGKVYLTQKKYTEAITTLNDVVGKYSLLPNISDVFETTNKTNNEIIFSIQFDKNILGEGHGLWFSLTDVSISPFTTKLQNGFEMGDARKLMIEYQSIGNLFVPGKFFDTLSSATNDYGNDYILLRYADVVLMLAEAINEQSYTTSGNAYTYLNSVRSRAGLEPLTSAELQNQASFRDAVLNERFLEFPLEGHRWFDLIRMGAAQQEISDIGISIQNYQLLYPIPQTEIEKINNTTLYYQNTGY